MKVSKKVIINSVKDSVECRTWYGQVVVEDVKRSLKELLHWEIQFVRREGNLIGHKLAKFAFKLENFTCSVEECPDFISCLFSIVMACNE